jgi:pilus assembly protein CpaE
LPPDTPAPAFELSTALPASQGLLAGVFSGRGGVGKSAVALMLALVARDRGLRVALVDLDLQFGDISYLSGKEERGRLRKVALESVAHDGLGFEGTAGELLVVEAPSRPEQAELLLSHIPAVLERLCAAFDVVIANTGSFWSDLHAVLARRCSHLVFLMDQRSTSVNACKQATDLCVRLQVPQARFLYALNGCGRYAALSAQDVSLALGGAEVCELADGGALVDELLSLGCPGELAYSKNAFVLSLSALFEQLTAECLFAEQGRKAGAVSLGAGRKDAGKGGAASSGGRAAWRLPNLAGFFSGAGRSSRVAS